MKDERYEMLAVGMPLLQYIWSTYLGRVFRVYHFTRGVVEMYMEYMHGPSNPATTLKSPPGCLHLIQAMFSVSRTQEEILR